MESLKFSLEATETAIKEENDDENPVSDPDPVSEEQDQSEDFNRQYSIRVETFEDDETEPIIFDFAEPTVDKQPEPVAVVKPEPAEVIEPDSAVVVKPAPALSEQPAQIVNHVGKQEETKQPQKNGIQLIAELESKPEKKPKPERATQNFVNIGMQAGLFYLEPLPSDGIEAITNQIKPDQTR